MQIEFSKEQFKDLVLLSSIGGYIRSGVAEARDEDFEYWEKIPEYLLKNAKKFDLEELVEDFRGHLILSEKFANEVDEIVEEYNNDEFWHELEISFGKRDFCREVTKEDLEEIKNNNGWLPDKVHEYYHKYEKEFEDFGIDRLEIKE